MYMRGGKIDKTQYSEPEIKKQVITLNLGEKDVEFLDENGKDRSKAIRKIIKHIRQDKELKKRVMEQ